MSSILDALRKLEEEQAEYPATPVPPRPIEPAVREPAPRRSRSRRSTRRANRAPDRVQKLWIAVPVVIFGLGIIWAASTGMRQSDSVAVEPELVSAAVATPPALAEPTQISDEARSEATLDRIEADLRNAADESLRETRASVSDANLAAPIRSAEPKPEPVQPEPAAIPEPPPVAVAETLAGVNSEPEIAAASLAPIQIAVSPVPMEPSPEVVAVADPPVESVPETIELARAEAEIVEQEPKTYEEPIAPPRAEPSERYRRAMAVSNALRDGTPLVEEPKPKVEEDIRRYDIMTRTVRARFSIPELRINMLMQPNERNPQPSALIDYNKVYVGETIPGTEGRAHLIGVDIRGVAIEVGGERFYYPK